LTLLIFTSSVFFHGMGPIFPVDRLTKESYTEFLDNSLIPYIETHFDDGNVLLLHDNHPVHNSNHVRDWVTQNIGQHEDFVLPHQRYLRVINCRFFLIYWFFSLSPDMNPVENVGSILKHLVRNECTIFSSKSDLLGALNRAHEKLSTRTYRGYFIDLLESMPRRLEAVRLSQGGHTRYWNFSFKFNKSFVFLLIFYLNSINYLFFS
jgi:transposase